MALDVNIDLVLLAIIFIPLFLFTLITYFKSKHKSSGIHFAKEYAEKFNILGENGLYIFMLLFANVSLSFVVVLVWTVNGRGQIDIYNLAIPLITLLINIFIVRRIVTKDLPWP